MNNFKRKCWEVIFIGSLFFCFSFFNAENGYAESEYDFVEVDLTTMEQKDVQFDKTFMDNMPDTLEAMNSNRVGSRKLGIIGEDDRIKVENTKLFPYTPISRIYAYENHETLFFGGGSAALISEDMVLTCAHAVWNKEKGFLPKIHVAPATNLGVHPYGLSTAKKVYVMKKYLQNSDVYWDMALVKLDKPVGKQTGWLGLDYKENSDDIYTLTGYPGEYQGAMYTESRKIDQSIEGKASWEKEAIYSLFDGTGGNSGSPLYDSQNRISGVVSRFYVNNSNETTRLGASRISKEKFSMINYLLEENKYIPLENIELNHKEITLEWDEEINLTPIFTPENASHKDVEWSRSITSLGLSFASVDKNGKVTANSIGQGTTTVTAKTKDGNKIASCKVKVVKKKIPVTGIKIDSTKKTINLGETIQLSATVEPKNATNPKFKWQSSDSAVATITEEGNLTGLVSGITTISAVTEDGLFRSEFTVNVSNKDDYGNTKAEADELTVGKKYTGKIDYDLDQDHFFSKVDLNNPYVIITNKRFAAFEKSEDLENPINWFGGAGLRQVHKDGRSYATWETSNPYNKKLTYLHYFMRGKMGETYEIEFVPYKKTAPTVKEKEVKVKVGESYQIEAQAANELPEEYRLTKEVFYEKGNDRIAFGKNNPDNTNRTKEIIGVDPGTSSVTVIDEISYERTKINVTVVADKDDYGNTKAEADELTVGKKYTGKID
ncbi:Ig-like domain-containing protein, partial [Enterococcus moraviensis]